MRDIHTLFLVLAARPVLRAVSQLQMHRSFYVRAAERRRVVFPYAPQNQLFTRVGVYTSEMCMCIFTRTFRRIFRIKIPKACSIKKRTEGITAEFLERTL